MGELWAHDGSVSRDRPKTLPVCFCLQATRCSIGARTSHGEGPAVPCLALARVAATGPRATAREYGRKQHRPRRGGAARGPWVATTSAATATRNDRVADLASRHA